MALLPREAVETQGALEVTFGVLKKRARLPREAIATVGVLDALEIIVLWVTFGVLGETALLLREAVVVFVL